jgi:hypothetical protein
MAEDASIATMLHSLLQPNCNLEAMPLTVSAVPEPVAAHTMQAGRADLQ